MAVQRILRMGDPRLRRPAAAVEVLDPPELHALVADMWDTINAYDGAGLAAIQIGVPLRVVVFGVEDNPRYPDAPPVPGTVLVNPEINPLTADEEDGWEGCLSVPGMRGLVSRVTRIRYRGFIPTAIPSIGRRKASTPGSSSTNAIIWTVSFTPSASATCAPSVSLRSFSRAASSVGCGRRKNDEPRGPGG